MLLTEPLCGGRNSAFPAPEDVSPAGSKRVLGRATGNDQLAGEGAADQLAGAVKDTAGKVAQAAGQTIHDLNR